MTSSGYRGHSEKVFDLAFDPTNPHKLMTVGVRHIRFWTRSGGGLTWKRAVLGNLGKQLRRALFCL